LAEHNILGEKGEQIAVNYLLKKGYVIIATNWRMHKYELDIVAQQNNELVIVEVKTRSTDFFGNPEEAVTPTKQKHLVEGANCYIETNEIDFDCRFDVISVILNNSSQKITHFKDAFYPEVD
jgi:putative endonuclease